MNQKDADTISIKNGDYAQCEILKITIKVKIKINNSIQQGMAGLSVNLPLMPFIDLPGKGRFHKL
jgi:anaerobic selenocysteine-containing dehydrogenase